MIEVSRHFTYEKFNLLKRFVLNKIVDEVKQNALINPFKAEDWMDLYNEASRLFADIDKLMAQAQG